MLSWELHWKCCFSSNSLHFSPNNEVRKKERERVKVSFTLYTAELNFVTRLRGDTLPVAFYMLPLLSTHNHWLLPSTNFPNTNNQSSLFFWEETASLSLFLVTTPPLVYGVYAMSIQKSILSVAFHVFLSPFLLSYSLNHFTCSILIPLLLYTKVRSLGKEPDKALLRQCERRLKEREKKNKRK